MGEHEDGGVPIRGEGKSDASVQATVHDRGGHTLGTGAPCRLWWCRNEYPGAVVRSGFDRASQRGTSRQCCTERRPEHGCRSLGCPGEHGGGKCCGCCDPGGQLRSALCCGGQCRHQRGHPFSRGVAGGGRDAAPEYEREADVLQRAA